MADEKPQTVTVEALEYHTHAGKAYDKGDIYDVDPALVDTLGVQGKAKPVEVVAYSKRAGKAAAKAKAKAKAAPAKAKKPAGGKRKVR